MNGMPSDEVTSPMELNDYDDGSGELAEDCNGHQAQLNYGHQNEVPPE